jgi:hypothetical protein
MCPCLRLSRRSAAALAFAVLLAPCSRALAQDEPEPPAIRDISTMSATDLAREAAYRLHESSQQEEHYTYLITERNQNFINGMKVVDRTTGTENIFIGGQPYLHKISEDGKPLTGKALLAEEKLYTQALHDHTALTNEARARAMNHATRGFSNNIDRLADDFVVKLDGHQDIDGHDCVMLDATPKDGAPPQLQRHIRLAIDAKSHAVLDFRMELLAADNEFSKGSVIQTRYHEINGVVLPYEQTFDTVATFKELVNTPIQVHRVRTFTNYRRFKSTVTILSSVPTDGTDTPTELTEKPKTTHQP